MIADETVEFAFDLKTYHKNMNALCFAIEDCGFTILADGDLNFHKAALISSDIKRFFYMHMRHFERIIFVGIGLFFTLLLGIVIIDGFHPDLMTPIFSMALITIITTLGFLPLLFVLHLFNKISATFPIWNHVPLTTVQERYTTLYEKINRMSTEGPSIKLRDISDGKNHILELSNEHFTIYCY